MTANSYKNSNKKYANYNYLNNYLINNQIELNNNTTKKKSNSI